MSSTQCCFFHHIKYQHNDEVRGPGASLPLQINEEQKDLSTESSKQKLKSYDKKKYFMYSFNEIVLSVKQDNNNEKLLI